MKVKVLKGKGKYDKPYGIELEVGKGKDDRYIVDTLKKGVKVVDIEKDEKIRIVMKDII